GGGRAWSNRPGPADLDAAPMDDALPRLPGSQNSPLSLGRGGQRKTGVPRGAPEAPAPPSDRPTAAGAAPPAPAAPGFPLSLSRAFTRHRPVPVPEQLAEALGADRATFPQLLEMATVDDDGTPPPQPTPPTLPPLHRHTS